MQLAGGEGSSTLFIDTYYFWLIAIAAVLALRGLTNRHAREYVWAGLNLVFLCCVLGKQIAWLLGPGIVLFLILQAYRRLRHRLLITSVIVVSGLFFFVAHKTGYFAHAADGGVSVQQVLAGIGFSFVFLRIIDLARSLQDGRHEPPTAAAFVNYLVPFHMIAAGPIQAYDDFARQAPIPPSLTTRGALDAAQRVAGGLFKKFVLAYALQKVMLTNLEAGGVWFAIEVQVLLLWLYLDFSAYSDIAVGLGKLMGVATPENFDRPWRSRNLIDFWDRWHISLSHWIRRNLFIPIQLNLMRRYTTVDPVIIACAAIGVSFFMAGIWHGLSWGWLSWGAMHAVGLVAVRFYSAWLQRQLTPEQLDGYRNNRFILVAGRIATIEYAAIAFAIVFMVK